MLNNIFKCMSNVLSVFQTELQAEKKSYFLGSQTTIRQDQISAS